MSGVWRRSTGTPTTQKTPPRERDDDRYERGGGHATKKSPSDDADEGMTTKSLSGVEEDGTKMSLSTDGDDGGTRTSLNADGDDGGMRMTTV